MAFVSGEQHQHRAALRRALMGSFAGLAVSAGSTLAQSAEPGSAGGETGLMELPTISVQGAAAGSIQSKPTLAAKAD